MQIPGMYNSVVQPPPKDEDIFSKVIREMRYSTKSSREKGIILLGVFCMTSASKLANGNFLQGCWNVVSVENT